MEKLYTVNKNKTRTYLLLESIGHFCLNGSLGQAA